MNKRIISLVLALVMVLGTFTSVFAAEETKKAEVKEETKAEKVEKVVGKDNKIQYIIDKKFVEGYEDGSMGYDKNIKRSEITKLLVFANGNKELAERLQGTMKLYSDVDTAHWANGVINVGSTVKSDANGIEMLNGYPDGSFKPDNDVTYAELAKMLVVLAKEDLTADMAKNAKWAADWMTWAAQLGILDDVTVADSNKAATRADAFTMVYNALYAMKEFKRVPANEVRGIVSNLTNDKLTLNQDSEKEYKITGDTVIVEGNNKREQIVEVRNLNRLDLYKGSLVRVLLNDKKEVTHILELGNPKYLALGNEYGAKKEDNNIWKGVADNTVETAYYEDITSMKDAKQSDIDKEYATIKLNSSATKGDYIKFHKTNGNVIVDLKINSDTEVYVANPYNNIMKEVKDVNEALSLIGFRSYGSDYKIANVYAGYDSDDDKAAVAGFDNNRNTAKVIVFNVVSKDNDGDRYRVIESSGSNYSTTLEDTDGKKYDRDNILNKDNFPYNYGDKLDVIEVRGDVITTLLDHSKTKKYPVVKVKAINDNDNIVVEDRFENETKLYVGDADIFNAKQYKDLAKGDYLQFAMDDDSRNANEDVDVVSILEDNRDTRDLFDESGSVLNVVDGIEGKTAVGTVKAIGTAVAGDADVKVTIYVESNNWDKGINKTTQEFVVDKSIAKALKVGDNVKFMVETKDHTDDRAFDFYYNDGKNNPVVAEKDNNDLTAVEKEVNKFYEGGLTAGNLATAKTAIDNADGSYNERKAAKEEIQKYYDEKVVPAQKAIDEFLTNVTTAKEIAKAEKQVADAQKLVNALKDSEGKDNLQKRINALEKQIKEAKANITKEEKQGAFDDYVAELTTALGKVKVDKNTGNPDAEKAAVKAAVKAELDKVTAPAKAYYEITEVDTTNSTVKVDVKSTDADVDVTTVNIQAEDYTD